jgi:hypothetical protein
MSIRRLHRHTMPPSASPTSRDAGDLNRRKRRAILYSARLRLVAPAKYPPGPASQQAVAFEQAGLRDPAAGVEQMDKGVKSRLVDAPPDRLDICLRTTHHNAVIPPPLRSGVGRIGEAVQGRGFSGRQVKGAEHARDIGRGRTRDVPDPLLRHQL